MAIVLKHQTPAQFIARFRERFRTAEKEECARLANWLYDHYQAGDFTTAQLKNAFGMNTAQFNAFVTKVQTLRDQWLAIQAAKGE